MRTLDRQMHANTTMENRYLASMVFSSRVRLARNVAGQAFPGWNAPDERAELLARVSRVVQDDAIMEKPVMQIMGNLQPRERTVLLERRLISPALAAGDATAAVIFAREGDVSAMINEEDHLRLQAVLPGWQLPEVWNRVKDLHAGLEKRIAFAFSARYGYLTACPSNTGTGMRASVMVHLAGLQLLGEVEAVARGLQRMGYAVRGAYGEGSAANGGLYQISNQKTLGVPESETIASVQQTVRVLLDVEAKARARLSLDAPLVLQDAIGRAYGILRYAKLLRTGDAMDQLSAILLGVACGLIRGIKVEALRQLMFDIQPGHLQVQAGTSLSVAERDGYRATYLRQELAAMELV